MVIHPHVPVSMIYTTANGRSVDTDKDLSAPERHVLQKLFFWESMVPTLQDFRDRTLDALVKGWNASGPVSPGPAFQAIVRDLEAKVRRRLETGKAAQENSQTPSAG